MREIPTGEGEHRVRAVLGTRTVSDLPIATQQQVSIAKALVGNANILILDEPSAILTDAEIDVLFTVVRRLVASGVSVVYISHRLDELFRIADEVTVMRDGRTIGTYPIGELTVRKVAELMVGGILTEENNVREPSDARPAIELSGLALTGAFHDVDVAVRPGEVVALYGLVGSGVSEIAACVYGVEAATAGTITLDGERVRPRDPGHAQRLGIVLRLWEAILHGLEAAAHDVGPLEAVGIDSWAVNYGLIEDGGVLAGNPSSYRCSRTDGIPARVFGTIPAEHAYSISGTGMTTFNTIFQFAAEQPGRLNRMDAALLLPDLFGYWLTGRRVAEVTNASSTGLLDARSRDWSPDLLSAMEQHFEAPLSRLLPGVVEPGTVLGPARPDVLPLLTPAGEATPLVAVATHDTASAVVGVPADTPHFAYISCGTWSLVGLELDAPVLTEESRAANFTNELGLDGTVRYLRNVAGLWVLNECLRDWRAQRLAVELPDLLAQAARETPLRTLIDLNQETFLHPGDMPDRVVEAARLAGQPVPLNPA